MMTFSPFESVKFYLTIFLNFAIGTVSVLILSVFTILSLPVYLYRWIICQFVAPRWQPALGKPLTAFGSSYGAEFISKDFHSRSSRCVLVTSTIIQGTLPYEAILEDLDRKWIKAEEMTGDGKSTLRYPEFQQYVEDWKGILFWKGDREFTLKNHVKLHTIAENCTDSEQLVCNLMENLMNKPFPPNRSPWEVHIVHGYRNDKLFPPSNIYHHDRENVDVDHNEGGENDGKMTVFIMRLHHALADGFSVMSLEIEGLLGLSLDNNKTFRMPPQLPPKKIPFLKKIGSWVQLPLKMVHDLGYLAGLSFHPQMNSPWRIPDDRKRWRQLFARTPLISVEKISFIKGTLGVSFSSVLFSCLSAALSKTLQEKRAEQFKNRVKFLPVSTTLPFPRSPEERYKLRNRLSGTILELPITDMAPKDRLAQCETSYNLGKQNLLPAFLQFYVTTMASHLSAVTSFFFHNRVLSVGLSNFPGPTFPAYWMGKKILNTDVTVGGMPGVAGICFMALSCENHVRVAVTAENAVMSKEEMDVFMGHICNEIETLFNIAKQEELKVSIHSTDD